MLGGPLSSQHGVVRAVDAGTTDKGGPPVW
jgi:hypothetical protein